MSVKDIPSVPAHLKDKYKEVFQIDPSWLLRSAAHRGKWVDQSQSLNIYFAGTSGRELAGIYEYAWALGLKTTYYLRSLGASQVEKSTVNASEFGSTHKRDAGADAQIGNIVSEVTSSSIVSSVAATSVPTMMTPKIEASTPSVSQASPIPSTVSPIVSIISEQSVKPTSVMAEAPKMKYKITVMPEATCDGCQ